MILYAFWLVSGTKKLYYRWCHSFLFKLSFLGLLRNSTIEHCRAGWKTWNRKIETKKNPFPRCQSQVKSAPRKQKHAYIYSERFLSKGNSSKAKIVLGIDSIFCELKLVGGVNGEQLQTINVANVLLCRTYWFVVVTIKLILNQKKRSHY